MLDIKIKPYLLPLIYSCNVFSITVFVMEAIFTQSDSKRCTLFSGRNTTRSLSGYSNNNSSNKSTKTCKFFSSNSILKTVYFFHF